MSDDSDGADSRYHCPHPDCKRSFAELWRLVGGRHCRRRLLPRHALSSALRAVAEGALQGGPQRPGQRQGARARVRPTPRAPGRGCLQVLTRTALLHVGSSCRSAPSARRSSRLASTTWAARAPASCRLPGGARRGPAAPAWVACSPVVPSLTRRCLMHRPGARGLPRAGRPRTPHSSRGAVCVQMGSGAGLVLQRALVGRRPACGAPHRAGSAGARLAATGRAGPARHLHLCARRAPRRPGPLGAATRGACQPARADKRPPCAGSC